MRKFSGKGVCGAIAVGKATVLEKKPAHVRRYHTPSNDAEMERVNTAKRLAKAQLKEIYDKALPEVGETNASIFEIHMMLLDDEDYNEAIESIIFGQSVNAEYAVAVTSKNFSDMFSSMEDAYMRARAADIKDVSDRLIACMSGEHTPSEKTNEQSVICAYDLAPGETALLDKRCVLAFVTAHGSVNSHTAILARNMNIPAVIGVGEDFLTAVKNGDVVAVDGSSGEVVLNPDEDVMRAYEQKKTEVDNRRELFKKLKGKENITLDNRKINIYANIESTDGIGAALLNDAGGIGLFRSEFLYMENADYPTEQQQFDAYRRVLESMAGKKVIIRTLDIGADKSAPYFKLEKEENPAMGLRAIRLCLTRPEIFKTQLRALYRASVYGNLGIMFPMITSVGEVDRILSLCEQVKSELEKNGIPFDKGVETGLMIETPAAAIISDRLAERVDFFSVGTNDLTQYTLACDRQNPLTEQFCDPHHEAILRLIELSCKNAHKHGAWIGICGELAADTSLTKEFLKMGIDELSVSPPYILPLRNTVRNIDLTENNG